MARLHKTSIIIPPFSGNWSNYGKWLDGQISSIKLKYNHHQPSVNDPRGYIWKEPRGDGYAMYVVTKTNPLTLRHIHIGDAWTASNHSIRGIRLADVVNRISFEKGIIY